MPESNHLSDELIGALPAGDAVIGRVKVTDGSEVADVLDQGTSNGLAVVVLDGAGDPVTSFGGGTQYTEGATDASITGTALLFEGAADTLVAAPGTAADGLLVNLGANNDVTVASLPLPTGAATSAKQDTAQTALDAIKTAVEILDNVVSGSEAQVDIVAALPAGTNAIGKLAANSGVDIGDVDVTSMVSATFDHGANRDIDATAEQITSTSFACKFGVRLRADPANTGTIYIGNSDVTAGTTDATDGFPLRAGESVFLPVSNANIPYAIGSTTNQIVYWLAV